MLGEYLVPFGAGVDAAATWQVSFETQHASHGHPLADRQLHPRCFGRCMVGEANLAPFLTFTPLVATRT
jgi:hypothetical protein